MSTVFTLDILWGGLTSKVDTFLVSGEEEAAPQKVKHKKQAIAA